MGGLTGDELLRLPVRLHGIQLGTPTDVILDLDAERAIGLEVRCGDDVHRFLPLATANLGPGEIAVHSALILLEEPELAFYRERGTTLRSLRGLAVDRAGVRVGRCADVVLGDGGAIEALLVDDGSGASRVPLGDGVTIGSDAAA
jgi:sporulation protein YlmC with PRC-barrel domain